MTFSTFRILVALLLATSFSIAQSNYKFHELNEQQGLSNSTIHAITQDHLGFHWVGTEDGLFRYNGNEFEAFYTMGTSQRIPGSTINKLHVDKNNRVWILTNNGVGLYDYKTDQITNLLTNSQKLLPEERVFTAISETDKGDIYLGNSYGGIYKIRYSQNENPIEDSAIKVTQLDYEISDFEILNNHLWIGTWHHGIIKLNLNTLYLQFESDIATRTHLSIYDIYKDSNQHIFIGTSQGLKEIQTNGKRFKMTDSEIVIKDEILSILNDYNGILWLGTRDSGLYKYLLNDEGYYDLDKHFEAGISSKTVSYRTISSIHQGTNNFIWLGTHGKGLNVFNLSGEQFNAVTPSMPDLIANDNITSVWGIDETEDGRLWYSTDGAGLYQYNPQNDLSTKIASENGPIVVDDNAILSVAMIGEEIWLGTYSKGLNIINLKDNSVTRIQTSSKNHELQSNDIRVIHNDKSNITWVGTNRGGLHFYDTSRKQLKSIANTTNLDIRGIIDDPVDDGILWLATYGDGLVRFDTSENSIYKYNWNTEDKSQIPIALSINYSHNRIWLGTKNSGLQQFNLQSQSFEPLTLNGGLPSETVRAILPVGKHLWISGNRGLSVLNVESRNLSNYTSVEGLKLSQFNDGSALLTKNGQLAFGSIHGLSILDPNMVLAKNVLPSVNFLSLDYNNEAITSNTNQTLLSGALAITTQLQFKPDMDNFSIHFGAVDFTPSPTYEYSYYLENYDTNWSITKNSNVATYRNLPPGQYVFKARIHDNSTGQEGPINSIAISVAPPWWQTYWAYSALSLVLIGFLLASYRINEARIKRNEKRFYEKKLRANEIASMEEKMRFYTNFSHELRTPITLILGPVNDMLNNENLPESFISSLTLVKRNATTLLKLINRFLDFRKIDTEHSQLNVGHYDLSTLSIEEAESFQYLATERDIQLDFSYEPHLDCWVDIEKIQIILNNLLSNALKFTGSGGTVNFKAYQKKEWLIFKVKDNGSGISPDELDAIFKPFYQAKNSNSTGGSGLGLSISKSLAKMHGGTLTVKSEHGKGTTFKLKIPTGKAHFKNQSHVNYLNLKQGELEPENEHNLNIQEEAALPKLDNVNEQALLIVDDNEDIRNYIGSIFKDDFNIIYAENGAKALEIASKTSPDIIISDLMMPEMDGHEFCYNIKNEVSTSHIPVIILTAKSAKDAQLDSFEKGADAYITKPFDAELLKTRVHNLLETRKQLKERFKGNQWSVPEPGNSTEVAFLKRVEDKVIELLPNGKLTVPDLCQELGFSRTSLYRKIKSLTDLSINQFIRSIKLKKAAEMLITEDMNVSEVAFALDFTDLKYFRNAFKKQYGLMPSEHIKQYKAAPKIDQDQLKKELNIS